MLKHRSQNGRPSLWKKLGSSNGRSQPCDSGESIDTEDGRICAHLTHKTTPTPLHTQRLDGLHPISYALLTLPALGHTQAYVARLAVRVAAVHGEAYIVCIAFTPIEGRREERIPTLGTKEMLFVICPFSAQGWVIKCDEPLFDDRGLACITTGCKFLTKWSRQANDERKDKAGAPHGSRDGNTAVHRARMNLHARAVSDKQCSGSTLDASVHPWRSRLDRESRFRSSRRRVRRHDAWGQAVEEAMFP